MKQITFEYKLTSLIEQEKLNKITLSVLPEIRNIKSELNRGYDSRYAFAYVPFDQNNIKVVQDLAVKKRALNPSVLVVIGIGGSNLGTLAIHEAINGKLYNEKKQKLKVYFADTVDSDYISTILDLVEQELRSYKDVLITVISKSGTTTETIANLELFIALLKKYKFDKFNDYIVTITDKNSLLWNYAIDIESSILEIPKDVGGRYSVFTAVGLFPLAMLSIDINQLILGARDIVNDCLEEHENFSAISASILFYYYQKGIKINDSFLFSVDLESIGKWFRQLMAESIGKEFNKNNEKVEVGITPTVSIGSVDLHSLAQLYLSGPKDKFTTFVDIKNNFTDLKIPKFDEFENIVSDIQGINFSKIMNAIILGTQTAYHKRKMPFSKIIFKDKSAKTLGEFLQFKMFEIVYLGYLFNIDPFNQPNVELYKNETKNILRNKSV